MKNRRNFLAATAGALAGGAAMLLPKKVARAVDKGVRVLFNLGPNVKTSFNPQVADPEIDPSAYVHPYASVIGKVRIGKRVMIAPFASVRGDEGTPLWVGDDSNIQDGVVIHALETSEGGHKVEQNLFYVDGNEYAVFIGDRVSLAHQCQVHGPAVVCDDCFIGMQALVFKSVIGDGCVVEPGAKVVGVNVPAGRYVPMGTTLSQQSHADNLPKITEGYPFKTLNRGVVHVNTQLADAYNGQIPPELTEHPDRSETAAQ